MVKPAVVAYRKISSYDPATQIVKLVCGHWYASVMPSMVAEAANGHLHCAKCSRPLRVTTARVRPAPFWLAKVSK